MPIPPSVDGGNHLGITAFAPRSSRQTLLRGQITVFHPLTLAEKTGAFPGL
jgi:hypothetical protein